MVWLFCHLTANISKNRSMFDVCMSCTSIPFPWQRSIVIADMTCPMDVEFHLCVLSAHTWNSWVRWSSSDGSPQAPLRRVAKRSVLACNREQRYKSPSMWALIDMISKLHINEPNEVQIERNYIPT